MESLKNQIDNSPQALLSQIHSQHLEIQSQSERIEELEQQLDWFKRQVFGRKSERIVLPGQAELFSPEALDEAPSPPAEVQTITYERQKPKRKTLPKELPRERIELDVAQAEKYCPCCEGPRRRIGEESTEELAFQPAKFWVREYIRPKYACPNCEEGGVATAPLPPRLIPKGLFGPEVLAQLQVSKYEDHIPLHRQLKIFRRQGIELSESTVNGAVLDSAAKLMPLVDLLKPHVVAAERVFTDDTPIILKGNTAGERRQARLWVYIRQLYLIERQIKGKSIEERFWTRRRESLPVLREFKEWLDRQVGEVSTKSLFGEAVTYALNQWQALVEYVNHGLLEISNATAENALRPVAVSRKNWLFAGSERGGHTAAILFSLMATCKQNRVNPWQWLAHVFGVLPTTDPADYPKLLPFHFTERFPL